MLSFFAKLLLAATQLAPLLFAYAFVYRLINAWIAALFVVAALSLVVACKLLLGRMIRKIQKEELTIKSVESAESHLWVYILGYLYPLVYEQVATVRLDVLLFVFFILLLVINSSKVFNFNPVIQLLFRYSFYKVTTTHDFTYVLVSKQKIVNTRAPIDGRQLSPYMYLDAQG